MGARRTGRVERTAGPGRAGGGLSETPRPFDVREAQILASALRDFGQVRAWGGAFEAVAPEVGRAMRGREPPATATPAAQRAPMRVSILRCPGGGATGERTTPGGGGRPRKCRPCGGVWMVPQPPAAVRPVC